MSQQLSFDFIVFWCSFGNHQKIFNYTFTGFCLPLTPLIVSTDIFLILIHNIITQTMSDSLHELGFYHGCYYHIKNILT